MKYPFSFNTDVWPGVNKLAEEMNELGVELDKLRMVGGNEDTYWGDRPLRQNIIDEMGDVLAALTYTMSKNLTKDEIDAVFARREKKIERYKKWEREE